MKKEINKLLASERALLCLNRFCKLHRWTKDALGNPVDRLCVEFYITARPSHIYEIRSRHWFNILEEVQTYQTMAFADAAALLNKELANGYLRG